MFEITIYVICMEGVHDQMYVFERDLIIVHFTTLVCYKRM
jgi:hypothetical protein